MPLATAYREDPEFRARADEDPKSILAERDLELPPHVDVRVAENTDEVFYFVMPPDPNVALSGRIARHGRRRQVGEHDRLRRHRQHGGHHMHHGQLRGHRRQHRQRGQPRRLTADPMRIGG